MKMMTLVDDEGFKPCSHSLTLAVNGVVLLATCVICTVYSSTRCAIVINPRVNSADILGSP